MSVCLYIIVHKVQPKRWHFWLSGDLQQLQYEFTACLLTWEIFFWVIIQSDWYGLFYCEREKKYRY